LRLASQHDGPLKACTGGLDRAVEQFGHTQHGGGQDVPRSRRRLEIDGAVRVDSHLFDTVRCQHGPDAGDRRLHRDTAIRWNPVESAVFGFAEGSRFGSA
jgi:hypothetical protein